MPNLLQKLFNRGGAGVGAAVGGTVAPIIEDIAPPPTMDAEHESHPEDPYSWMVHSSWAEVLLLHSHEVKLMAMFGYALLHGYKLYPKLPEKSAVSFRFISLCLACTGGGILVPILINSIPVILADSYPFVIIAAFLIHEFYPLIREIIGLSPILKVTLIVLYECNRAKVISTLTLAAAKAIAPSEFQDFALFGPIFCGSIAGCGGAFLPLNKGLSPIQEGGLQQPMLSAFIAATCFHLFIHTSLSDGFIDAKYKAQLAMALFFIAYNVYETYFKDGGHGDSHGHKPAEHKVLGDKKTK